MGLPPIPRHQQRFQALTLSCFFFVCLCMSIENEAKFRQWANTPKVVGCGSWKRESVRSCVEAAAIHGGRSRSSCNNGTRRRRWKREQREKIGVNVNLEPSHAGSDHHHHPMEGQEELDSRKKGFC